MAIGTASAINPTADKNIQISSRGKISTRRMWGFNPFKAAKKAAQRLVQKARQASQAIARAVAAKARAVAAGIRATKARILAVAAKVKAAALKAADKAKAIAKAIAKKTLCIKNRQSC